MCIQQTIHYRSRCCYSISIPQPEERSSTDLNKFLSLSLLAANFSLSFASLFSRTAWFRHPIVLLTTTIIPFQQCGHGLVSNFLFFMRRRRWFFAAFYWILKTENRQNEFFDGINPTIRAVAWGFFIFCGNFSIGFLKKYRAWFREVFELR